MSTNRYRATGVQAEFEPGSRRRVLRHLLSITRARDMNLAESQALEIAQDLALDRFDDDHRFMAHDICELHTLWLGPIYPWAGEYRSVDISKGGFQFAHARLRWTSAPCWGEGGASTLVESMPQWGGTMGPWRLCSKKLSCARSSALLPKSRKTFLGGRCFCFSSCSKRGANAFHRR